MGHFSKKWVVQTHSNVAKLLYMHQMTVELISLRPAGTRLVARARAKADDEDIRLWFEVTFTPEGEPWTDAYDRVLALLDIA